MPDAALPRDPDLAARVNLAACYRLVALYGMDDVVYTHISARLPGRHDRFLINPFGTMFEEITPSMLIEVDLDGRVVNGDGRVNEAGFTIHSAIHAARPEVDCVIHTHTRAGMAVSALGEGILPLSQKSLVFHDRLAFHAYEGLAFDLDERARLVADLGHHKAMLLANHGLLTCGRDCAEAFSLMWHLELACRVQLDVLQTHRSPRLIPAPIAARGAEQLATYPLGPDVLEWPALLRKLDRSQPGWRA